MRDQQLKSHEKPLMKGQKLEMAKKRLFRCSLEQ